MNLLHKKNPNSALPRDRSPRLLAIQIAGIGDLVLATPALDALRERYPDARIDLLTSPRAVGLLQGHPALDEVFAFDIGRFRNPLSLLLPGNGRDLKDSIAPMRKVGYDALLSLNNISTTRGAWTLGGLMKLIGAPIWVGRNTDSRAPWFDCAVTDHSDEPTPEALTKLRVAACLDASTQDRPLHLPIRDEDRRKIEELLPPSTKPFAAILPGANVEMKRWPVERFGRVAEHLAQRGYQIVTLGGTEDRVVVDRMQGSASVNLLRFEGMLNLSETAAMLAACSVTVSNDTGPMHMAAAVGTPLVALFCSVNVSRYRPWMDEKKYRVLTTEPAGVDPKSREGMRSSMQGITIDRVLGALEELEQEVAS